MYSTTYLEHNFFHCSFMRGCKYSGFSSSFAHANITTCSIISVGRFQMNYFGSVAQSHALLWEGGMKIIFLLASPPGSSVTREKLLMMEMHDLNIIWTCSGHLRVRVQYLLAVYNYCWQLLLISYRNFAVGHRPALTESSVRAACWLDIINLFIWVPVSFDPSWLELIGTKSTYERKNILQDVIWDNEIIIFIFTIFSAHQTHYCLCSHNELEGNDKLQRNHLLDTKII